MYVLLAGTILGVDLHSQGCLSGKGVVCWPKQAFIFLSCCYSTLDRQCQLEILEEPTSVYCKDQE